MIISLTYANWPAAALPPDVQADRIAVEKGKRQMRLFREGRLLKVYDVSLGGEPVGHKVQEGDRRTPEGIYQIDFWRCISLIQLLRTFRTQRKGVSPGGAIMIHGIRNGFGWLGRLHLLFDWTAGCVAVTNPEIEELWRVVPVGTEVEIIS
ncbi:MAG: L,D-transpeptidase family protein [Candidatus Manganitrophus sp.]|nr:MAG: L,D-transpeptidase family protein [Candidatus Manganitrophus sp.]